MGVRFPLNICYYSSVNSSSSGLFFVKGYLCTASTFLKLWICLYCLHPIDFISVGHMHLEFFSSWFPNLWHTFSKYSLMILWVSLVPVLVISFSGYPMGNRMLYPCCRSLKISFPISSVSHCSFKMYCLILKCLCAF